MRCHAGILDGAPRRDDEYELAVLALTPGIPIEWVIHAAKLNPVRRATLKRNMRSPHPEAADNALSITPDDALKMLEVIRPEYRGAVPLYSQLWLQGSDLTDEKIAKILGVKTGRIQYWRTNNVFDPLTGERLIHRMGAPNA